MCSIVYGEQPLKHTMPRFVQFSIICPVLKSVGHNRVETVDLLKENTHLLLSTRVILKMVFQARVHKSLDLKNNHI